MKSNDELRAKARELRSGGMSILKIVKELKVPKSTIFGWIRDVVLTEEQRKSLSRSESGALKKAIETVKKNRVDRWNVYRIEADKELYILGKGRK
jgi:transposase